MSKRKHKWRGVLAQCGPDAIKLTRTLLGTWLDGCDVGRNMVLLMGRKRAMDAAMELIDDGWAWFEGEPQEDGLAYTFVCDFPARPPGAALH